MIPKEIKHKLTQIKVTNNLELYQALCKIMEEHTVDFNEFWKEVKNVSILRTDVNGHHGADCRLGKEHPCLFNEKQKK